MSQFVSNNNSHSLFAGLRVDCWVIQQSCLSGKTAKISPLPTFTSKIAYLQPHSISIAIYLYVMRPQFSIAPAAKSGMANKSGWVYDCVQHTPDFKPEIYTYINTYICILWNNGGHIKLGDFVRRHVILIYQLQNYHIFTKIEKVSGAVVNGNTPCLGRG